MSAAGRNESAVDFLIAGFQKSGTTTLLRVLREHPDVYMPKREVGFFNQTWNVRWADEWPEWSEVDHAYRAKLSLKLWHRFKLIGEKTPGYIRPGVADRIHFYAPGSKLIFALRNPVERAYSAWNMAVQKGKIQETFLEAVKREKAALMGGEESTGKQFIRRSFYFRHLRPYYELFDSSQIHVLLQENLAQDFNGTIRDIYRFLGLSFQKNSEVRRYHVRAYEKPLSLNEWSAAYELIEHDISALEEYLGWDLSDWRKPPSE